jgi:hypothetical protein
MDPNEEDCDEDEVDVVMRSDVLRSLRRIRRRQQQQTLM